MPSGLTKIISFFISFCFILEQSAFAQSIDLSAHLANFGKSIVQTDKFRPLHLRSISYDSQSQDFQLLLDKGDTLKGLSPKGTVPEEERFQDDVQTLLRYFFIGLSLPNDKFWVNLRPDSPENILDPDLERTDIGRIFLEADLQLKKDTAQWTSPQTPEGKQYWDKLYKKAVELFGTENITIPTITRPWIVPNEIILREFPDNGSTALTTSAYIYKATLKVMLEEDYLQGHTYEVREPHLVGVESVYSFSDPRLKELNQYSTQQIKDLIIPKLTYEVNTSKRYAPLRQVYYSLILAQWFKQRFKGRFSESSSLLGRTVPDIDSSDLTNLTSKGPWDKQTYFKQYQKSFKDGECNLSEPAYTPYGQSIRRYMSGGISGLMASSAVIIHSVGMRLDRNYLISVVYNGSGVLSSTVGGEGNKNSYASSAVFTYTLEPFHVWMQKFLKPQEAFLSESEKIRNRYVKNDTEKQLSADETLKVLPGLKQFKQMKKEEARSFLLHILKSQQEQGKVPLTWKLLFSWRDDVPPIIFYDEIRDLLSGYNLARIITPVARGFERSVDDIDMTEFFFVNGVYVGYGITRIINDFELEMQFQIFPTTTHQELGRGKVKGLSLAIFRSRLNLWANLTPDFRVSVEKHQFPDIDTPAFYLKLGFQPYFKPKADGTLDYSGGLVFDLSNSRNDSPKNIPSFASSAVKKGLLLNLNTASSGIEMIGYSSKITEEYNKSLKSAHEIYLKEDQGFVERVIQALNKRSGSKNVNVNDFVKLASYLYYHFTFMGDFDSTYKELISQVPILDDTNLKSGFRKMSAFAEQYTFKEDARDFVMHLGKVSCVQGLKYIEESGQGGETIAGNINPDSEANKQPFYDLVSGAYPIVYFRNLSSNRKYIFVDKNPFVVSYLNFAKEIMGIPDSMVEVKEADILELPIPGQSAGTLRLNNIAAYIDIEDIPDGWYEKIKISIVPGGQLIVGYLSDSGNSKLINQPIVEKFKKILESHKWKIEEKKDAIVFTRASSALEVSKFYNKDPGGIDFNALPIVTQQIKSLQSLVSSPLSLNPNLDFDKEWTQIQQISNADIRLSVQRLVEFSAASASSPAESRRIEDVLGLIADLLRQEEESQKLIPTDPALKGLLIALESERTKQ